MSQPTPNRPSAGRSSFPTTQWSMVVAAGDANDPNSAAAMESLCRKYWRPLYMYVRRLGHPPDDALNLTQEFFARLLERRSLRRADVRRGRFRAFLITALRHFLNDEWDRKTAVKRGGGQSIRSLDIEDIEDHYEAELCDDMSPDKVYERHWAMAVLDHVLARLLREYSTAGNTDEFQSLQPFLWGERGPISYADVAAELGVNINAVKVAAHRLRARYRKLLCGEIAETLAPGDDLEEEMRHLFAALA